MDKRGFTLVELSIVLVIIGLLIGGILVAQSMVSTAKSTRIVNNVSQYEIAVNNFILNFKRAPGDSNLFTPPGDNDGGSTDSPGNCAGETESTNSFAHLSQSKMLDGDYIAFCTSPDTANYTSDTNFGLVYPKIADLKVVTGGAWSGTRPYLWLSKNPAIPTLSLTLTLPPVEFITLQKKMGYTAQAAAMVNGGWSNNEGEGNCVDGIDGFVHDCIAGKDFTYGIMTYYMLPKN